MGIVTKIRSAFGGTEEEPREVYVCETCGAEFDTNRTTCTSCGGRSIVLGGN